MSVDEVAVVGVIDGVETIQSPSDYTVTIESETGGSVIYATAPLAAIGDLYIRSDPAFTQDLDLANPNGLDPEAIERAFDLAAVRSLFLRSVATAALAGVIAIAPDVAALMALVAANGTPFAYDATPEGLGAIGDGVHDDSNAIEALMALGGPAWLGGPNGTAVYKITRALTGSKSVQWRQHPNSRIDNSALGTGVVGLTFSGAFSAAINLTANALKGAQTVQLASVPGITKGTLLKIVSNAVFDPARTASKIGELRFARSVVGSTVTIASSFAEDYNTADAAKAYVITPLMGFSLSGVSVTGSEGGKFSLGIVVRGAVNPRIIQCSFRYNSDCGLRISDCVGGETVGLYTEISETTDTGYGIVFAHATRGHVCKGHVSVLCRHAVTTGNSNTVSFEGIPRDNTYEDFTVLGSQTSVAFAGGAGVDSHCAANGYLIRNGVILNATGPAINIECPNVSIENVVVIGCLSHAISLFNISSRDGTFTVRGLAADGCVRGINGQEGFNGATGKVTKVTIDGMSVKNNTSNFLLWNCLQATANTKFVVDGMELDMALMATGNGIDVTRAASWKSGPVDIANVPAALTGIRLRDVAMIHTASPPTIAYNPAVPSTGIGFTIDPAAAAFVIRGEVSAIVTASDTGGANTAKGVRVGAQVRGTLRVRDVQGTCATPYNPLAGSVAIPPTGYKFTTALRPVVPVDSHCMIWDTTLGKPVWEDITASATDWSDATGADA